MGAKKLLWPLLAEMLQGLRAFLRVDVTCFIPLVVSLLVVFYVGGFWLNFILAEMLIFCVGALRAEHGKRGHWTVKMLFSRIATLVGTGHRVA